MLELILAATTKRLGVKMGVGVVPFADFLNTNVNMEAVDEPASSVLARLFEQIVTQNSVTTPAKTGYSYQALYDPGVK